MDAQMFVLIIERFFMTESRKVYGPFAEEKRSEIEYSTSPQRFQWRRPMVDKDGRLSGNN